MEIRSELPLASTNVTATLLIKTKTNDLTPQELDYVNSISQSVLKSVDKVGGSTKNLLKQVTPRKQYTLYTYPETKAEAKTLHREAMALSVDERIKFLSVKGVTHRGNMKNYLAKVRLDWSL